MTIAKTNLVIIMTAILFTGAVTFAAEIPTAEALKGKGVGMSKQVLLLESVD